MKLVDDSDMNKRQVTRIALLFKQCGIHCINRFSHLNNVDQQEFNIPIISIQVIAGKYKAKERLRGKAMLPLKTEPLHLQRVCIFMNMKKYSMWIRYKRWFSFKMLRSPDI